MAKWRNILLENFIFITFLNYLYLYILKINIVYSRLLLYNISTELYIRMESF
ncbi:Hypothetical protein NF53_p6064 (plasmid) [Bacillus thuringiensis serovar indiana]|nr:Hypothetical protein NF53_p6064 [Bacillus thuringiensis serovar indiana]EHL67577.1 hypothetical protein HMPREF1014_04888 [Bacillus sp. 7_6_55CFAA_CT2]